MPEAHQNEAPDADSNEVTMDASRMGPFQYVSNPDGSPALFLGNRLAIIQPMASPNQDDLLHAIDIANRTEHDLTPQPELGKRTSHLSITFAATTAVDTYQEPYYHEHQEGPTLARLAARLWAVIPGRYHPHILACNAMNVVAMSAAGDDTEFARRWLAERNILSGIPKGNHRHEDGHFFNQAVHATLRDLAQLPPDPDVGTPDTVLRRVKAHIESRALSKTMEYGEAVTLLGITAWMSGARTAGISTDHEDANKDFDIMNKIMNDVYATPALSWVRCAYNRRIAERRLEA